MRIETKKAQVLFTNPSDLIDPGGNLHTKEITVKEFYFNAESFKKMRTVGNKVVMRFEAKNGDDWEILNLILNEEEAARLAGRLNYELVMHGVKDV